MHFFIEDKSPQVIRKTLDQYYGDFASSIETIFKWFLIFWIGHMSTKDAKLSDRSLC